MFFRAESGLAGPARVNKRYPGLPGSSTVQVRLIGPLWAPGIFKKITDPATATTVKWGKDLIQSRTPVKTGNLRSQWMTSENTIFNDEYYTNFVEYGTIFFEGYFMAYNSTKEIEAFYIKEIQREIGFRLGSSVGAFFKVKR